MIQFDHRRVPRKCRWTRPGSVYLFVLCASLLVVVIGVSAIALSRVSVRDGQASNDLTTARYYARSAIELGLQKIQADANWRTTLGVSVWIPTTTFDRGTIRLQATAIDTSVPSNDTVTLLGTGTCGQAVQMLQAVVRRGAVIDQSGWSRKVN